MEQYIVFKLDKQLYGLNIQHINNIERMKPIIHVPKVNSCIKGVMNLRGDILPVVSLREQFKLEVKEYTDRTRIIIVELDDAMVGLIVDEVKEVIEVKSTQVEAVSSIQSKMKANNILGVGKIGEDIVTLLNLENIIEEAFAFMIYE